MTQRTQRIIFWICTIIIVLFEGVMPIVFFNAEQSKQGILHLGYPEYFRIMLVIFKVLGAIALLVPVKKGFLKEWAYAGFAFDFIAACVSHACVDGFKFNAVFPLLFLVILLVSHHFYRRLSGLDRFVFSSKI